MDLQLQFSLTHRPQNGTQTAVISEKGLLTPAAIILLFKIELKILSSELSPKLHHTAG